ncbi:GNAT family N-acetyltransferase [Halobacillus seohaensis]|uniref:GNAT family N-acetyltransferase n=1 Tax=Halobacillus seohaensis TaxID=447421 RepID=A0ABW2EI42_9BACI
MNYNVTIDVAGIDNCSDSLYQEIIKCKKEDSTNYARIQKAVQPLNMMVSNSEQKSMGGISSELYWNWLEINNCWVNEHYRNNGIGTQLIRTVERMARKRGADYSMLTTFEDQTRNFYEMNGYKVVGEIKDYITYQELIFIL